MLDRAEGVLIALRRCTMDVGVEEIVSASKRRAGEPMIRHAVSAVACWVRGRYPRWAPPRGHIALVALCGRDEQLSVSSERTPS